LQHGVDIYEATRIFPVSKLAKSGSFFGKVSVGVKKHNSALLLHWLSELFPYEDFDILAFPVSSTCHDVLVTTFVGRPNAVRIAKKKKAQ